MLRRLYDWTMALAAHRHARLALAGVSFAESSFFPIPPDIVLIPMVLADRAKAWFFASISTIASVIGGFAGYLIGFYLFDTVGKPLLEFYGYSGAFDDFATRYNTYGAWIVFIAGITPFPYKVITIASGVTALDPVIFGVASVAARGLRFFFVCGLLYWFGPPIRRFIEKYLGLLAVIFVVMLVAGFAVIKLFFPN
jgi:membrane protein YqaA with SNARE-associated domain